MLYPTVRPKNPLEGQLVWDANVGKYNIYMGSNFGWVYFDESGPYYICVVCKADLYEHKDDHPFCKNNLDLLEWKYEQQEAKTINE